MIPLYVSSILTLFIGVIIAAEIPSSRWLSLQGMMQNISGQRMPDGKHFTCFRIYSSPESSDEMWSQCDSLSIENGMYHTLLGKTSLLPFATEASTWLELSVDQETLPGRVPLTGSPTAWSASVVTDSILPGTGMGPGISVRSLNKMRDDITLKTLGNLEIQSANNIITLKGNDAYTISEKARVDIALTHAQSSHFSPDSVQVLRFIPLKDPFEGLPSKCTANTEGSLYFAREHYSDGSSAFLFCIKVGIQYLWVPWTPIP